MGSLRNYTSNGDATSSDTVGKVITCKAAVAYSPGQPLVVEEILVDPPQKMEVRIKILFTSICHSDLSAWQGENEAQRVYPRILGHEASGLVESVGEGVTDMVIGDHVVPIFNGECGDCIYCKSEKTNLCDKFRVNAFKSGMTNDGKTRFSTKDGKPIYHFLNTSTFSEYTVLDSACVVKIDQKAPLKKMTLLSCGVSTGLGAVWNTANVQAGATVAVFGLGAVGLAVVEGARTRGASRIIGVDVNPDKRFKGEAIGITDFINPKDMEIPVHQRLIDQAGCKSKNLHEWQGPEGESQHANSQDRPPQYFSENLPHTGIEPALPEDFSPHHLKPYQLAYAPGGGYSYSFFNPSS